MYARIKQQIEEDLGKRIIRSEWNGLVYMESGKVYFLKSGKESARFQCEARGLKELQQAHAVEIAQVASVGNQYILTAYIPQCNPTDNFYNHFGAQLAQLHRHQADTYGWKEDNFIGDTPQINIPSAHEATDWITFFFNKRLLYQYQLAEKNQYITPILKQGFLGLESQLEQLLRPSIEPPTLLHGDLWSGNYLCNTQQRAVLIDPAVYYGHREADLAMTKMFGGFAPSFYQAYQATYPLTPGWEERERVYLLYHVLNHLNLFGTAYLDQAETLLRRFL